MARRFRLAEHMAWRKTAAGAVVLDLETSRYYTFNRTGTRLLELLDKAASPERMAEALAAEYGVSPKRVLSDVERLLARMSKDGLAKQAKARSKRS